MLRQINFEKKNPSKVQFSLKNDTTKMVKSGRTIWKGINENENCKSDIAGGEVISNENDNDNDNDEEEDEEQAASRLFILSLLVHGKYQLSSAS